MKPIRFGTEGWRARLAEDYTFDRVRAVARATGEWFKRQPYQAPVAVGHDTRFLGDRFAAAVADELAGCGVEAQLSVGSLPTPATGFHVVQSKLAGAVVLTASHNPAEWNGVKVKGPQGASALEEQAKEIEAEANEILRSPPEEWAPERKHERFDVRDAYLDRLLGMVDAKAIAQAKLTVVADLMHGAGIGYFEEAFRRVGCAEVRVVRGNPDPTFGGLHPEPIGPNLGMSIPLTADPAVAIGMATDGDADRLGVMAHGEYVDVQRTIIFILYHLLKNRGWRGRVVRALNVTFGVDRLCEHYGCTVTETSVGFKNIAPEMVKSTDIVLAVEESGGYGIRGHIPDRDGTLAALTACEALTCEGKPVREIMSDVFAQVGGLPFFDRKDIRLTPQQREVVAERLPLLEPESLAGRAVDSVNRLDGAKYVLVDGSWILMRLSGTEPLIRVYAEARSSKDVGALLEDGERLVTQMTEGG
ncbi:MAG: phosphoglucomutase/phosphomannomutase family protein [Proteobacteria bacterium]|nr:phosphoglucomutase/phosphomannomutase family protein [Pseudomonadota bacterium]